MTTIAMLKKTTMKKCQFQRKKKYKKKPINLKFCLFRLKKCVLIYSLCCVSIVYHHWKWRDCGIAFTIAQTPQKTAIFQRRAWHGFNVVLSPLPAVVWTRVVGRHCAHSVHVGTTQQSQRTGKPLLAAGAIRFGCLAWLIGRAVQSGAGEPAARVAPDRPARVHPGAGGGARAVLGRGVSTGGLPADAGHRDNVCKCEEEWFEKVGRKSEKKNYGFNWWKKNYMCLIDGLKFWSGFKKVKLV